MVTDAAFARLGVLVRQLQGSASRRGRVTVAFDGSGPESGAGGIFHGFDGGANVQVSPSSRAGAVAVVVWTTATTDTSVNVRARTVDGSTPAAGTTCTVDWEAGR